jgi:hypothetical protein
LNLNADSVKGAKSVILFIHLVRSWPTRQGSATQSHLSMSSHRPDTVPIVRCWRQVWQQTQYLDGFHEHYCRRSGRYWTRLSIKAFPATSSWDPIYYISKLPSGVFYRPFTHSAKYRLWMSPSVAQVEPLSSTNTTPSLILSGRRKHWFLARNTYLRSRLTKSERILLQRADVTGIRITIRRYRLHALSIIYADGSTSAWLGDPTNGWTGVMYGSNLKILLDITNMYIQIRNFPGWRRLCRYLPPLYPDWQYIAADMASLV